jgi:hypothetical protein
MFLHVEVVEILSFYCGCLDFLFVVELTRVSSFLLPWVSFLLDTTQLSIAVETTLRFDSLPISLWMQRIVTQCLQSQDHKAGLTEFCGVH